jgi:hypothetical protein
MPILHLYLIATSYLVWNNKAMFVETLEAIGAAVSVAELSNKTFQF